jgi:hypothetical protein
MHDIRLGCERVRDDVLDVSEESIAVLVVVGHEQLARADRVNVIGRTHERVVDGSYVLCGRASEDVAEDFNLGADDILGRFGVRDWYGRSVIDCVDVDCGQVLRVVEYVDPVRDECADKVFEVEDRGFEGL